MLWLFFGAARADGGSGEPRLGYYEGGAWKSPWVDRDGGLVHERERLAHFTYALHYLWHDVTGEWLYIGAGLLAAPCSCSCSSPASSST